MHVLLDLDGTLVDTNASKFDDIKFGRDRNFALGDIPIVPGAMNFVAELKRRGHSVAIVSDSHAAYVGPVSEKVFEAPWLALADKPNTAKLRAFLESEFGFPRKSLPEEFLLVGDTRLDIQLARGLSLPSALIFRGVDDVPHDPFHNEESAWARRYMEGATYTCHSFEDLLRVVEAPAKQRGRVPTVGVGGRARSPRRSAARGRWWRWAAIVDLRSRFGLRDLEPDGDDDDRRENGADRAD